MPTSPRYPSIPVPKANVESLLETVNTLKRTVEMLTGQDKSDKNAARVHVHTEAPTDAMLGDLWLCTGSEYSLSIWAANRWLKIAVLPTPAPSSTSETDILAPWKKS